MTQEAIALRTSGGAYPGLEVVQDVNKALDTIATDFAGASDPAALAGPYMTWADTGNMLLKRRNAAGTAWVVEGTLFKRSTPEYAIGDIPATDQGPIDVIGIGRMEWDGIKYTRLDMSGFPAFSAYPTAVQTISSGVETLMTFGAEEFDTHGYYDTTTYRFTPKIAGAYQINAGAFFASPAPTLSYLAVYKNSGAHKIGNQGPLLNATLSALIQMNGTTDYLNLYGQQTSGGLKDIGTGSSLCYFQAVLVRPA